MPEWIVEFLKPAAGGGVLLGILYLIGKFIDRRKPEHEVLGAVNEDLRESIESVSEQLHTYENDLARLRSELTRVHKELTKHTVRLHEMTLAVHECIIEHPETTRWWQARLAKMET